MLSNSRVEANIPAGDLKRARDFYGDALGLTPTREIEGVQLTYQTEYAGQAGHTIAQFHVDDIESDVRDLKAKGVAFEVYEGMPGVEWNGEIASIEGMGRAAWFKDSEGNILCIDQEESGS